MKKNINCSGIEMKVGNEVQNSQEQRTPASKHETSAHYGWANCYRIYADYGSKNECWSFITRKKLPLCRLHLYS
jgi:hypothetical protein